LVTYASGPPVALNGCAAGAWSLAAAGSQHGSAGSKESEEL